ncbi:MAG: cytochrome C oxidase subunit IV family protein [Nitrospirota bacterium]|jgi:cytochrome c oxidase subunit 4
MSNQTDHRSGHPGTRVYLAVAAVLTVLTAIEVTVFYVPAMKPVLLPVLLILSAAKFALVVMFYMHLKFDRAAYGAIFIAQLFIAAVVIIALMVLFAVFLGAR